MPAEGIIQVPITTVTALTAQTVLFPGLVEWIQVINNGAPNVFVLGQGEDLLFKAWPGDVWPYRFENVDVDRIRIYGDIVNTAAEILASDVVFIRYKLKSRRG